MNPLESAIKRKLQSDGVNTQNVINKGYSSLTDNLIKEKVDKQISSVTNQITDSIKIEIDKLDPTDPNYATDTKNINDKWQKALDKLETKKVDALIKDEIITRDAGLTKNLPPLVTRYKNTNTYLNQNDKLDENKLLDEEKDINDIISTLGKLEEYIIQNLDTMTETFIKKVITNPTLTKSIVKKKTPSKTQAIVKAPPKVQLPPIYTTYESFKKKFEDTVKDYLANPTNYKKFNSKTIQHNHIKSRFKAYQALADADKQTFFT